MLFIYWFMNFFNKKKVHFIGIGGVSMSALALFSMECGAAVSGSDMKWSKTLKRLSDGGAVVYTGEKAEYIDDSDVVVYTSAIRDDNAELRRARELNKTIYERHDFLGMAAEKFQTVIAVGGTHGKTTVTAMIAHALRELGADFTAMIGGDAADMGNYYNSTQHLFKRNDFCRSSYESFSKTEYESSLRKAICKNPANEGFGGSAENALNLNLDNAMKPPHNLNRLNAASTDNCSYIDDGEKLKKIFVTEACEYKQHLLSLYPDIGIITNIECDHPDCYGDLDSIKKVFAQFAKQSGVCVLPVDEKEISDKDIIAVDISNTVDDEKEAIGMKSQINRGRELLRLSREDLPYCGGANSFKVLFNNRLAAVAEINQQGEFNKNNAMFAIGTVCALGYKPQEVCDALSTFKGVKRRFEKVGEYDGAQIVFDFAHHPTEIVCSLGIAKKAGRVLAVFQPHTYSRTAKYFNAFVDALKNADGLIFMPTYAARENPEDGTDCYELYSAQKSLIGEDKPVLYANSRADTVRLVKEAAIDYDMVIFIGAGDIYDLKDEFFMLTETD